MKAFTVAVMMALFASTAHSAPLSVAARTNVVAKFKADCLSRGGKLQYDHGWVCDKK